MPLGVIPPSVRFFARFRFVLVALASSNGARGTWIYYPGLDTDTNRSPSTFHAATRYHSQPGLSKPGGTPIRSLHLLEALTVHFGRSTVW